MPSILEVSEQQKKLKVLEKMDARVGDRKGTKVFKCKKCGIYFTDFKNKKRKYCSKSCNHLKTGTLIDKDGYKRILTKDRHPSGVFKYILEHRIIIENTICRKLKRQEDVHHINGNRSDNRIHNLMVFNGRSSHRRYEMGGTYNKSEIIFNGKEYHEK